MEDGSEVAVKRILIQTAKNIGENEKAILTLIDTTKSPFIVSYRSFLKDSTFMYLVIDLCEEALNEHIISQSLKYVLENGRRMIKEILTGLDFLHSQGILHRDLKPSNVLVDVEGHMRLTDFGISRVLNEDETTVQTNANGTLGWMPSEVIEAINEGGKGRFKKKSDVQVAGMIAYFILSKGEHPFGALYERMGNILNGNPVNLKNLNDPDAQQFVSKLISQKISDRPYASEALGCLYINGGENIEQAFRSIDKKSDHTNPNLEKPFDRTILPSDHENESLDEDMYDSFADYVPDSDNPEDYDHYSPDENESNNGNPDDDEDNLWNENEDFDDNESEDFDDDVKYHSDTYENDGNSAIDYEYDHEEDDENDGECDYVNDYENDDGDDNEDEIWY